MTKEWETYIDPITVSGGGGNETFAYSCQYCEGYTEPEEPKDTMKHTTWCPVPTIKRLEDIVDGFYQHFDRSFHTTDYIGEMLTKVDEFYKEKVTND